MRRERNIQTELLKEIKGKEVRAIWLRLYRVEYSLPIFYTPEMFQKFLKSINTDYYAGYRSQSLEGVIWYTDGTWSERVECDGFELWEYRSVPNLNEYFCNKT